jgi:hypothetical protein
MRLANPEWLLLLPALAVAAWRWPRLGLLQPLRAAAMILLVLAMVRPTTSASSRAIDLWVLADRSASCAAAAGKSLPEWEAILERSKRPGDELHLIDFAASPMVRGRGDSNSIDPLESRTAFAVRFALEQLVPERASRILLLSDGYATEPLTEVVEPLIKRGIPLDYRLFFSPAGVDYRVDSIEAPTRVQAAEGFLIEGRIVASEDGDIPFEVLRDDQKIGEGTALVRKGEARLRFSDRLRAPGAHRYGIRLLPEKDAHPENNLAETWVEVAAGSRVVLITAYDQDPLAAALRESGFTVEQVTDPAKLHAGTLSGARLVILNNVPSHRLPPEFLGGLDFFVREQGGGLLMCGGKFSFGSGGYFASAIDPLLPVSMELRKEHRKLRIAMAVVMDRSGSMGVTVSTGGRTVTKMDLADEGAARSVALLADEDRVTIIAVDSAPHIMVPLKEVGPSRDEIISKTRRIQSEGGGIFIYEALKGGWAELKKAEIGQRHLILFADAADSEEPGDYKRLLEEITAAGVTVSVIGMGSDHDSDSELLKDIAARGKGRVLFNANPNELPAMFAQETVAIARSAFIDEPTPFKATAGWMELAARPIDWLAQIDGYNLSYLKPGATAAGLTTDEYAAPLVSFWHRGQGRTAAITFPMSGDFSKSTRAWARYSDFATTLCHWLTGEDVPAGLGVVPKLRGTELSIDLFYGDDWTQRLAENGPKLVLGGALPGTTRAIPWQRLAPGHFQSKVSLRPGERARGAVQVGESVLPFGPVAAGSNAEWQFRREAVSELQALSNMTGGRERLDLATAWETPPQQHPFELRPWLVALLLLVVVAEALMTRLGGAT